jgi:hypothetical protein
LVLYTYYKLKGLQIRDKVQENKHNCKKFNNPGWFMSGLLFETFYDKELK